MFTRAFASYYFAMLNYLVGKFTESVRDPLWKDVLFTPEILKITQHPQFQKLSRIKQLGPASFVYPGAVHTRFSHCIGVYHIARQIMLNLYKQGSFEYTQTGVISFLVACLLHDLGHFPYAHSLKDVIKRSHETLATDIINTDKELSNLIEQTGADVKQVCSIIDPDSFPATDKETKFYQNLLSGALDPDKLDYLCRDAYFCGVPYGVQDVSWITDHIKNTDTYPALSINHASSVEHMLFSKYLMYRNVYWHEKTRCLTAMVRNAVVNALRDGVLKESDLYFLDDEQFITLCKSKDYPAFKLVEASRNGQALFTNRTFSCPENFTEKDRRIYLNDALEKLSSKCEEFSVIVDVPEPISFDSNLRLIDENGNIVMFNETDSVFASENISKTFTKTLRKIRIFSPVDEAL